LVVITIGAPRSARWFAHLAVDLGREGFVTVEIGRKGTNDIFGEAPCRLANLVVNLGL